MDLHKDTLHLCTSRTVGSTKEGAPYLCKEHTSIILKSRVQVLHSFLNAVFQVYIHHWIYYNLCIMQYFPRQHPEGCAPRDPHPTAMSLLSQSLFHPRHCQRENARRGDSRVWKRRWLKPGSAGALLGTIVGCDTAGQCEAEILPGMAEWAHSVVKGNSLLAIFYSPAQKLQPRGEGGGHQPCASRKGYGLALSLASVIAKLFFFVLPFPFPPPPPGVTKSVEEGKVLGRGRAVAEPPQLPSGPGPSDPPAPLGAPGVGGGQPPPPSRRSPPTPKFGQLGPAAPPAVEARPAAGERGRHDARPPRPLSRCLPAYLSLDFHTPL